MRIIMKKFSCFFRETTFKNKKKNFNFKLNNSNKEDHDERNDRITAGIVGFACGSFGENI